MSTLMQFQKGADFLQFEAGGDYPARRKHFLGQVTDRTASGGLQVEELGLYIKTRVIVFNLMSAADYEALLAWFLNIAVGSKNSFIFIDEYGDEGEVKITDADIDFPETSYKRFSGSLTLEFMQ